MLKKTKKGLALTTACVMAAGCLAGCGTKIDSTEVVATVEGTEIPMGVAAMYTRYQQASVYYMYGTYYGMTEIFDMVTDYETYATYGETMKDSLIESLEDMYILKNHAEEYDVTLTEEEVAEAEEAAKKFVEDNDAEVLETIGTTEEDVAELFQLYKYQSKMYYAMIEDTDTEVSDEEAKQSALTYVKFDLTTTDDDGNSVTMTEDEMEAQNDLAEELLAKVAEQEDVAEADMDALAKEVNEDLYATTTTYDDESTAIDSEILTAVEGLADGELVEEVVMSSDGTALYVVRFDADLDRDATDAEKESIISTRQQENYQEELTEWKDVAEITVNEKVWKKITLNDSQVFTIAEEAEEDTADDAADTAEDDTADDVSDEEAE